MKYAIISDIHGNYPALKAVLSDAETQGVQTHLFIGDYIEDLPYPNEVVDVIRTHPSAVVVRGNKEDYLENLIGEDQSTWDSEQFAVIRWSFRELTPQNLKYLVSLPKEAEIITEHGQKIWLRHSSPVFYRKPRIEAFHSSHYLKKMKVSPFNHEEYVEYARSSVLERTDVMTELSGYPKGVHAFGHNHLQWHMQMGGVCYVNPGSCGIPLDFDTRAPYTIIEDSGNGWTVTERRVPYDVESAIKALASSELYKQAEIWSQIMIAQLRIGGDYISHYLRHVNVLAAEHGCPTNPVSNEMWRLGALTFDMLDLI